VSGLSLHIESTDSMIVFVWFGVFYVWCVWWYMYVDISMKVNLSPSIACLQHETFDFMILLPTLFFLQHEQKV